MTTTPAVTMHMRHTERKAGRQEGRQRNRVVSGWTGWCWWVGAVAEVRRGMVFVAGERYHRAGLFLERRRWWDAVITTHQISEQLATLCCHIYKFSRRVLVTAHKPHKWGGWALRGAVLGAYEECVQQMRCFNKIQRVTTVSIAAGAERRGLDQSAISNVTSRGGAQKIKQPEHRKTLNPNPVPATSAAPPC